jgi:hypothetical protein
MKYTNTHTPSVPPGMKKKEKKKQNLMASTNFGSETKCEQNEIGESELLPRDAKSCG